ncbi:MAG: Yip1 family protein [Calditrichia bacterium]
MADDNNPKDGKKQHSTEDSSELKDLLGKISESDKPREKAAASPKSEDIIKKPSGTSDDNENIDSWIEKITEQEDDNTPEEMGIGVRLLSLISQPTQLFRYLRNKPDVIIPIVLTILIAVASSYFTYDMQIDKQVEIFEGMNTEIFSDAQKDEMIDEIEASRHGFERIKAVFIFTPIGAVLFLVVVSLLLWFFGRVVLGGESDFMQSFSTFGYASLIFTVLGGLIKLPLMLSQNTLDVNFSLGRLLDADNSSALYRFLSGIDPFTIWTVFVLGIGLAVINRFSTKKGIIAISVLWLLFLLVFNVGAMGLINRMGIL